MLTKLKDFLLAIILTPFFAVYLPYKFLKWYIPRLVGYTKIVNQKGWTKKDIGEIILTAIIANLVLAGLMVLYRVFIDLDLNFTDGSASITTQLLAMYLFGVVWFFLPACLLSYHATVSTIASEHHPSKKIKLSKVKRTPVQS